MLPARGAAPAGAEPTFPWLRGAGSGLCGCVSTEPGAAWEQMAAQLRADKNRALKSKAKVNDILTVCSVSFSQVQSGKLRLSDSPESCREWGWGWAGPGRKAEQGQQQCFS